MGGPLDPNLIANILQLVKSPRVKYTAKQFGSLAPRSVGGPLTTGHGRMPSMPQPTRGASVAGSGGGGGHLGGNLGAGAGAGLGQVLGDLVNGMDMQQFDPIAAMYDQLVGQLQSPVQQPQEIDRNALMEQVKAAINPIYDARANAAKANSEHAQQNVTNMYNALAQDYKDLAPQQAAQAQQSQKDIEQMYGQLRSNIEGSYSRVSKEQADLFKSLGIQDALPEVLGDQNAAVQDASIAASENQAQQQQRYEDIGNMDETYYREGAPIAVQTGNEYNVDLLNQLQNYLGQVEGDRASGIQSGYMDQLAQAQNQYNQQQQMAYGEADRRQQMLWQMLQAQLQAASQTPQQQALTPDSYMQQLDPNMQSSVAGAFTQLERSPEAVYGKVEDPRNPVPGTYVETTPEWYMAQADQMLQRGEIDPATHQALEMYLRLYFKTGQ